MGEPGNPTHPQPSGPMVEFYLGKSIRGAALQTDAEQFLPVGINGYQYSLKMGARNKVPKEVYEQLMNSRSRTVVVDVEKASRNPRTQNNYRTPSADQTRTETLSDYEVEFIKEDK